MANTQFTDVSSVTVLAAANPIRTGLVIENNDTGTLFIGDAAALTTSTGIEIAAGDKWVMDYEGGTAQFFFRGEISGIGTSVDVRVWEIENPRL